MGRYMRKNPRRAWLLRLTALPLTAFLLAVTSAMSATQPGLPATMQAWGNQIVYMILIDRFADGNPANDLGVDRSDPRGWHGGDLEGIIQHLDYLKSLGITAIWISPFFFNDPGGYHGYWPADFERVDPHFGDLATLKRLVAEAHRRHIRVIFDMVLNHTGHTHPWLADPSKYNWYHHLGPIIDWSDPQQVEQGDLAGLPDLAQENPEASQYLIRMSIRWLDATGADGFRLDAARHIPIAFWRTFTSAIAERRPDFLFLGEVWLSDPFAIAPYQEAGINTPLDFPMFEAITSSFAKGLGPRDVVRALQMRSAYRHPNALGVFVDNHDVPRFVTMANKYGGLAIPKLKAALTFAFTIPGIPVVDYGTEVGMEGGPDPDNRRDMQFDTNPALMAWFRQLTQLRRSHEALAAGTDMQILANQRPVLAYLRRAGSDQVMVILNMSDERAVASLKAPAGPLAWFSGSRPVAWRGGSIRLHLDPWEAVVLTSRPMVPAWLPVAIGLAAAAAALSILAWTRQSSQRAV